MTQPTDLAHLLAEDAWARRLARALAGRSEEDPEDLVQEAYARGLARGVSPTAEARGWFARVLRNLRIERRRARGAREQREAEYARARAGAGRGTSRVDSAADAGPSDRRNQEARDDEARDHEPGPDELVARAEVQERLAAAVLALPPRQRDVLLLRHFDGASVADIARRLALAPPTVQEHLARGHAELRRRLASSEPDARWARGFALLVGARAEPGVGSAASGVAAQAVSPTTLFIAMTSSKVSLGVALAVVVSLALWRVLEAPPERSSERDGAITTAELVPHTEVAADEAPGVRAAAGERVAVATPDVDTTTPAGAEATVHVHVVDELGASLEGASVSVVLTTEEEAAYRVELGDGLSLLDVPAGLSGRTDRDGATTLVIPPGRARRITATLRGQVGAVEYASSEGSAEVAALAAGTSAAVTIGVKTRPDVDTIVSVVDAVSGAPVVGARVFLQMASARDGADFGRATVLPPPRDADGVTDFAGRTGLRARSWLGAWCIVLAPGYGPRVAALWAPKGAAPERTEANTTQPALLRRVELDRGACIEVQAEGAPAGAEVRARMSSNPLWERSLVSDLQERHLGASSYERHASDDGHGEFVLQDLPAGASVSLTLHAPDTGEVLFAAPAPLETRAGEVHQVVWDLAVHRRFVCTVREADGSPAPGQVVRLSPPGGKMIGRTDVGRRAVATATSDAAGVAIFEGVAPGAWVLALAPSEQRRRGGASVLPPERDYAAYEQQVEMPTHEADVPVEFTLHRGLYIEGRVVSPSGEFPWVFVSAWTTGFTARAQGSELDDGRFRLGPLLPGLYTVAAGVFAMDGPPLTSAKPIEVQAGTTGALLTLRRGGRLALRAVDGGTGEHVDAQFSVSRIGGGNGYAMSPGAREVFVTFGLEPGRYSACALAPDGRVGVVEAVVAEPSAEPSSEPDSGPTEVTVPLVAGGTLTVVGPEDVALCDVYILRGEAVLDLHRLKSGQRERTVLPPGRYRVGVAVCREDEVQPAWRDRFDREHVADVHVGAETVLTTTP